MSVSRTSFLLTIVGLVVGELLAVVVAGGSFLHFVAVSTSIRPSSSTLFFPRRIHHRAGSKVLLQSYSSQEAGASITIATTNTTIEGILYYKLMEIAAQPDRPHGHNGGALLGAHGMPIRSDRVRVLQHRRQHLKAELVGPVSERALAAWRIPPAEQTNPTCCCGCCLAATPSTSNSSRPADGAPNSLSASSDRRTWCCAASASTTRGGRSSCCCVPWSARWARTVSRRSSPSSSAGAAPRYEEQGQWVPPHVLWSPHPQIPSEARRAFVTGAFAASVAFGGVHHCNVLDMWLHFSCAQLASSLRDSSTAEASKASGAHRTTEFGGNNQVKQLSFIFLRSEAKKIRINSSSL